MHDPLPRFTVVIPTFERCRQLGECLGSLAEQDYPRDRFDVVVVDDGGERPPDAVVAGFRGRIRIELIVRPHGGPARARNAGASVATGDYLAFTDDDCTPAPDWLRRLAGRFAESPGHAIGGRTINRLPRNPYAAASQMLIDYLYASFACRRGRFFTTNNLAVPTSRFREIGGFDSRMPLAAAEDREFCARWADRGYPLLEAPEAVVEHAHTLDFCGFCRQHFNYGRGAYSYRRIVASREQRSLGIEPLRFYSDLLRYPLKREGGLWSLRLAMLMLIAQAANLSGFVYERLRPCHTLDARGLEG